MKQIISIGIVAMFIMTGLMAMPEGVTMDAEAVIYPALAANCGTVQYKLNNGETNYDDVVDGINGVETVTIPNIMGAGQNKPDGYPIPSYSVYRGIIGLNCSALDKDSAITYKLHVKTHTTAWGNTGEDKPEGFIDVYSRPASETTFNWSNFGTNMTYVGQLTDISDEGLEDSTWLSIDVSPSAISTADWSAEYGAGVDTVFYLVSSREGIESTSHEYALFSIAEPPYLVSTGLYSGETILSYYEDAATWTNNTILPVERMEHNLTHDMYRYELYVMNASWSGIEWMVITLNSDFDFFTSHTISTVTSLGGGSWNITNYLGCTAVVADWPPYYLYLWFSVPRDTIQTECSIQLWHSTFGEGFIWEKFKVMVSNGTEYNESISSRVISQTTYFDLGTTQTFMVTDYFGNNITSKTVAMSGYRVDVLIPVNVFSVTFNSFRNDTTAFAVYFNATGTPYQDHCSGGKEVKMAIREGTYMFRFDYLTSNVTGHTTLEATYFYNLTINGTYTINFGAGGIGILFTSISGIEILIANIATNMAYQDINWVLDDPIYALGGTKAAGGVFVLDADPNIVIDSTAEFIQIDSTAGAATLWGGHIDESLMFGDWAYFSDFLTISCSNTSARLVINDTTLSTVLISTSAPSGATFDIFSDNGSSVGNNLTAWVSDGSFALRRTIYFRWARELSWNFQANNDYYFAYATINNSLPTVLRNPTVLITFPELQEDQQINFEKIEVEDMDNNLVLPEGQNYTVDNTGISFGMRQISPSTVRQFKLSLYTQNATREGTEYIQAQEVPVTETYKSKNYRMVYGDYTNEESSTFTGNIVFILTHEETKDILSNTVRVIDQITGFELVPNGDYVFTGSVVNIFPSYVGEIGQGEIIKIKVYYLTDETAGMAAVSVDIGGVPLWGVVYIILIIAGLIAAVLYAWGNKKKGHKKFGESMGKFIIVVGIAATFLMVVYSLVGGYGLS